MSSPKYHDLLAVNKCQKSNTFSDLAPSTHTWIGFHFKKQGLLEDHSVLRPESTKGNGCSSTSHFCKSHIPKISGVLTELLVRTQKNHLHPHRIKARLLQFMKGESRKIDREYITKYKSIDNHEKRRLGKRKIRHLCTGG